MRKIKRLMEHIEKELDDAHTYAEEALEYPAFDSETVELFHKLSADEMNHMSLLHKDVVRMIEAYRQKKGELPADMMARYEHLHKRFIAEAERVGVLQGMYKK